MKFIKLPYLLAFLFFILFGCKPKEKDQPKPQPEALDTEITKLGINLNNDRYFGSKLDSSTNTYYIVFDTTKVYFYKKETELKLSIITKGLLSIPESSNFNISDTTYFEVGDGLGKFTKYTIVPILSYAKSDFEYTFESYSEDSVNIEYNKKIRIFGVNENTYQWSSFLFKTGFSPIFEDQYANTIDNIYLNIVTNDLTPLLIDNITVNNGGYNLIWSYVRIKNIPRDPESRTLFFQQKNYQNLSVDCEFDYFSSLERQNRFHKSKEAYADFISYNPLLETIDLDIYFKSPLNYTSETTRGEAIDGKIELRNFSIKNTSY